MGAGFQSQVADEIACFFQGDVFLRAVVFEDAKGIVCADFAAGQVDIFSRFAVAEDDAPVSLSPKMMPARRCFWAIWLMLFPPRQR